LLFLTQVLCNIITLLATLQCVAEDTQLRVDERRKAFEDALNDIDARQDAVNARLERGEVRGRERYKIADRFVDKV
jgi:hypothetical protein